MIFQRVTPDRYNDVILHLRRAFFFDEPLNKAVKLCTAGMGNEELENYSIATLEDGKLNTFFTSKIADQSAITWWNLFI